ncbi:hypothetical protein K437DRAFT_253142 [Tilletiaria anomala UBC 951]|uniref:Matrin-type domain-containing protein n=1 Tax=Tilletiaria anomala (strain ATCC 24038 / CBS 436.72 / UBC 951) TaxID=1037660 RepID=A0A066WI12_TILAU|nr:uncharacterized protein K437DRAFT_253142 [Tilletiaria anomala UBC 951]KDN53446.1 hypothetical protein K437DRAFT_253142 [Tilletiaria anomala UBC 951]
MADTSIFEVARATHEEIERYEQAAVDLLMSSSSSSTLGHKEHLKRDHKISELLDRIVSRKQYLKELYADVNGERTRELEQLSSTTISGAVDPFGEFYKRLNRIKDYHRKYPQAAPETFVVDFTSLESSSGLPSEGASGSAEIAAAAAGLGGLDFVDRMFSGEESSGRFMDLYTQHDMYMNLKGVKRLPYVVYLDHFDKLSGEESRIPHEAKRTEAYRKYLSSLKSYLATFLRKTRPLEDVDVVEERALATFEEDWAAGTVPGLGKDVQPTAASESKAAMAGNAMSIDGQGIWCEACRRFYSKQTVYDAHLKSPKHQKAAGRLAAAAGADTNGEGNSNGSGVGKSKQTSGAGSDEKVKITVRLELLVQAYAKELDSIRNETKSNVERRAALTERERQAEAERAEEEANNPDAAGAAESAVAAVDEDGEDNEKIYNPLRLPLGWDGKPIPYWLYKLHGLGVDYKCEICSDYVYQGRKNFEKHFQESRHAFGMRALGLPNTKHFHEITKIPDALALADKLKKQGRALAEEQGDAEEVEDEHGNTYSRKTYDMMKRQGLL